MATITLRVLDGADRGKIFEDIKVPVTIGREEGNTIQLNDERISRFHLKIQKDHDDLVLTDLESTNGSRVNNEDVRLRILRHGDLITVGRSTLIFGKRVEINERLERLSSANKALDLGDSNASKPSGDLSVQGDWQEDPNYQLALLDLDPPRLPERMSPGQAAQLSEVIEFLHMHLRSVVADVEIDPRMNRIVLSNKQWQKVLDAQARLAEFLLKISDPE